MFNELEYGISEYKKIYSKNQIKFPTDLNLNNHLEWFIESTRILNNLIIFLESNIKTPFTVNVNINIFDINLIFENSCCEINNKIDSILEDILEQYININIFFYASSCRYFLHSDYRFINQKIYDLSNNLKFKLIEES